jgi:hypothetical protein
MFWNSVNKQNTNPSPGDKTICSLDCLFVGSLWEKGGEWFIVRMYIDTRFVLVTGRPNYSSHAPITSIKLIFVKDSSIKAESMKFIFD